MKKVRRVKVETSGKSTVEVINYARNIKTKMDGDTRFDTLDTQATTLATSVNVLESLNNEAEQAELILEQKIAQRDAQRAEVEAQLTVLGSGVENVAAGETTVVLASGFNVQAERTAVGPVGAPQNLEAKTADMEGEIDSKWSPVRGAKSYIVEYKPDDEPDAPWKQIGVTTRSKFTVAGLTSGKKYRVRVCALGAAGTGPYSDEAVKMAA